jgi:hypothetical protein
VAHSIDANTDWIIGDAGTSYCTDKRPRVIVHL